MSGCPSALLEHRPNPAAEVAAERGLVDRSRCFGCGARLRYEQGINPGGYAWSRWVAYETEETR